MEALISISWMLTVALVAALAAGCVWAYRQRTRALRLAGESRSSEFSLDSYRPMEALLSEEDFEFLRRQPGYRPEIGTRWKRERQRIFREYLHELSADFCRLHQMAREAVAHSGAESSALVGTLFRQQFVFWFAITGLEVRLALHGMGIGSVNVRPLMEFVEAIRVDLARLASAQTA